MSLKKYETKRLYEKHVYCGHGVAIPGNGPLIIEFSTNMVSDGSMAVPPQNC